MPQLEGFCTGLLSLGHGHHVMDVALAESYGWVKWWTFKAISREKKSKPEELRLAAAGWLRGFGNPPLPPPPGWLDGWLARSRKTAKIRSHT